MKRVSSLLISFLLLLSISACTAEDKSKSVDSESEASAATSEKIETASIIGSWECVDYKGAIYTFNADGTGSYTFEGSVMAFTYTDNGNEVELKYENATVPSTHKYTIKADFLLIEDSFGSTVTYKKTN